MYKHYLNYSGAGEPFNYQVSISKNPLGISEINFIWAQHKKLLNIIMKSDQRFNREVKASLKGNSLVLSEHDSGIGLEVKAMKISRSEVELKAGFDYTITSSEIIDPGLFKVTLAYKSVTNHRVHEN